VPIEVLWFSAAGQLIDRAATPPPPPRTVCGRVPSQGRGEEAVAAFHRALELDRCYAHALYNLGQHYLAQPQPQPQPRRRPDTARRPAPEDGGGGGGDDNVSRAIEFFGRAVSCDPSNAGAQEAAGGERNGRPHPLN
jgi:tetratricopeptide (TPR) repeat protein